MTAPWNTACPDWEARLLAGRPLVPDLPLFRAEADRALRVFKRLRVPDVIGMPTMGEAGGPWFFAIVEALFGAYDPSTDVRHIREAFVLVPKKNGKSSTSGALAVTTLIVNRRPAAEFLFIAPTKQIADIAFRQASLTIKADEDLSALFHTQTHIRRITHRRTDAIMQIKAADTDAITGGKNAYALIDETHEFAKKPRAAEVFVEIRGALAARPDGFLIQLTTQSKEPPAGVFKAELAIARDVRDGKLASPLLPILYELPERLSKDGGWKNRRLWPLVNPNLGRSVNEPFLVDQLAKAEHTGAEQLALLASQHFNVEIGQSLRADRWAGADFWQAAGDRRVTLAAILDRCEVCVAGLDGGGLDDLLAVVILGRERETRRWLAFARAFAHISVLRRRKAEAAALIDFAYDGDLVFVDGDGVVAPDRLARLIDAPEDDVPPPAANPPIAADSVEFPPDIAGVVALCETVDDAGLLAGVGIDPAGVGMIVDALAASGIYPETEGQVTRVHAVSQGYKLMGSIKTAERKLADGTLLHGAQPMMAWCVGNAKTEVKGNAVMITKQIATGKIDPLMALFDAVALMSLNPEIEASVYTADRGLAVFG